MTLKVAAFADHEKARECISLARLLVASPEEIDEFQASFGDNVDVTDMFFPPTSIKTELAALRLVQRSAQHALDSFPNSLEEDEELLSQLYEHLSTSNTSMDALPPELQQLLQQPDVEPTNALHCIIQRRGEKKVFRSILELVHRVLPLLTLQWNDLSPLIDRCYQASTLAHRLTRYDLYVVNIIAPLVRKDSMARNTSSKQ